MNYKIFYFHTQEDDGVKREEAAELLELLGKGWNIISTGLDPHKIIYILQGGIVNNQPLK